MASTCRRASELTAGMSEAEGACRYPLREGSRNSQCWEEVPGRVQSSALALPATSRMHLDLMLVAVGYLEDNREGQELSPSLVVLTTCS